MAVRAEECLRGHLTF
jgi:hypothetical protein